MQGTSVNPGLIPRTLDLLFDSLKEKLELNKAAICKFKPDKFNEIVSLTESEHEKELAHKKQLLGLAKEVAGTSVPKASGNMAKTKQYSSSASSLVNKLANVRVPDNKKYIIWMSFYELYNDNIYDLLEVFDPKINSNVRPLIREDKNKVPFVDGVNHVPVFSSDEAIRIFKYGEKRLHKSRTSINESSSRSHAVFCLKFVAIERDVTGVSDHSIFTINQLSFCDLAGNEQLYKTGASDDILDESKHINTSLTALSRCINEMTLSKKQITFRENKLTRLFQAYFEGRGMVKMIVNLNPSLACFDDSINVLNFANSATKIQINLNDMDKNQYIYENEKQNTRTGENVEQRDGANAKADDGTTLASRIKL
jgi:hypothetical protein